ncbi:choice-of-anchor J domain-containing protein [Flavobacterium hauense]
MNQKLFEKSPDDYSGACRFLSWKSIIGKLCLIVLLNLISTAGFAQLATENFDGGIPATWPRAYVGGTSQWTTSTDGYLGSAGAAFIDPSAEVLGSGTTARYYLFTPPFAVPSNGELRFFTKQSSATDFGNIYEVRLSTVGPSDISSFSTVLGTFTEAQLTTTAGYEEKALSLGNIAPGLNIYIAFVLVNQQVGATPNADTWLIDNVSVQTATVCNPVVATTITAPAANITTSTATINWTHPTATQFQIIVQQAALPAPGASAVGTTVTGAGPSFSYAAGGLTASTAYKAYIKAICSVTPSAWVTTTANTFSTVAVGSYCSNPIIVPATGAPYTFTGNLSTFANAAVTYPNPGTGCLSPAITQNYMTGAKAFFSYTPTQDGLISVTNVTTANSALNGFNHSTGFFVYDGCSNVAVACLGANTTSTAAVPATINNVFVQAGHTYIIVVSSNLTATAGILFTLSVQSAACAPPGVFTYKDLLQTSVKFSWNNVGNFASAWEYKVQAAGAGVPTGAGTATPTNIDVNINTGLAAGTSYDLYVRSVCGGTPGAWSAPYRFTTQCTMFPTPYSQNFTGATPAAPTPCWTILDVNNDVVAWTYLSSSYATIAVNGNQNYNNDYFVSPQVNFTGVQKRLRYKHQAVGGNVKYSIKISTTGVGVDNFTTVLMPETSFATMTAFQERIINIPTSITGPVNIAFIVTPGTGNTATRISIDDVFIEDKPACPDPILPTVSNITTTTAQFAWTVGDTETQWEVVVQPLGTGVPTADGILVNSNPYTATVLPSTAYEYYVRAYCSSTQKSNWVGPVAFNTVCGVFNTPFVENFNNGDPANSHKFCWTITDVNGGGTFTLGTPTVPVTEAQLVRPGFNAPTSYNDWLITPAINVIGTKELKFKYKSATSIFHATARNGLEVLMSTTDTNPASFTVISPLLVSTNVDYVEKALYINANGPVYIAFRVPPTYSVAPGTANLYIDDVRIDEAPACPNPSLLTVSNITVNSARFSWTKGFLETQWQVAVQPVGTGVPTAGTLVDTNPEFNTVAPLLADTQYEVYVRAYCSGTDQSNWIGPIKFKTLCNPIASPFTETFNPDSATEQCWLVRNDVGTGTGGGLVYTWNTNAGINPYEGDHAAGIFSGSNGDNNDWLISPTITVTAGQRLRYYYRTNSSDYYEDLEVLLSTTGIESANFTTVLSSADYFDTPPLNNTEWKEKVINLPAGVTGNINIAWRIPPKPSNAWGYRGQMLLIDKVVIEDIPACSQPANLAVLNITDVQAQLKWDTTGTETAWDVYVQPAGLAAPVGDGNPAYLTTVTTNPYTKTGLTAATKYDYYVRAACTDTDSPWVGPFQFTSMCSYENLCEYNITLANPVNFGDIQGEIRLIQNQVVVQTFNLTTTAGGSSQTFPVFLCDGVEYSLFWDAVGSVPSSGEAQATVTIKKADGTNVWTSPQGVGPMNDVIYTGFAACSVVTCPNPTNLTVTDGVLSWTAGGAETQWEVFVQPLNNGTLPQAGTLITTNSYTPVAADFANLANGTYEFFVRAVCSTTNKSYWSAPFRFLRNDSAAKAVVVPVNTGDTCEVSSANATFLGATPSTEPMTCTGVNNGDIWYQFQATSTAHIIELGNFSGDYYNSSGNPPHPFITMTLYRVNGAALEELSCSSVNSITAAYSTATIIGDTYKVRLTLNNNEKTNAAPVANTRAYTFDVCVKTPTNPCLIGIANGSFEDPEAAFGGLTNMFSKQLVPAWRYNIPGNEYFFFMDFSGTAPGGTPVPYEGTQFIQLLTNQTTPNYDPADMVNIEGLYQDFDTSEMTQLTYSYAQAIRASSPTAVQMFMGPPAGPFVLLEDNFSNSKEWTVQTGIYDVPAGQSKTRILFRTKNPIGSWIVLDAISIVPNNEILTLPHSVACGVDGTSVSARGVGQWIADERNPSDVVIATPTASTTSISGFVLSGDYTFTWKTRYCEETIVINKVANDEIPAVITPVEYCIDTVAVPLTAPELADYTLVWYDVATGGTALTAAPIPVTTAAGTTPYYVAYVDAAGCEGVRAQLDVVVNDKTNPVVGFTYDAATYCSIATNPVITLDADFAPNGTFTATPTGLAIDGITGAIDLSASTAGTYDVTYDVTAVDCINPGTNTVTVTVNAATNPVVDFTYTNDVCLNNTAALLPSEAVGFATGGTYSSATVTIDPVTGEIDLATATAGTHEIIYSIAADTSLAGCVNSGTSIFEITLVQPTVPVTGFTYAAEYCIAEANPTPAPDANFYTGGAFSATGGLTVDPVTGEIDLTTATPGIYDVIYAVTEADCLEAGSTTVTVVINALTAPVVAFSYESPTCINSGNELVPTLEDLFTLGGVFSSATVTVDAATGIIDLTSATQGIHDIQYILPVDALLCIDGGTFTTSVELKSGITPVTGFTYEDSYCYDSTDTLPETVTGFTTGGTFSSTAGLVINPATGEINVAGSTPGVYVITYTIVADDTTCNVGGSDIATVSVSGKLDIAVSQECRGNNAWLFANPVNASFDPETAGYVWKDKAGVTVSTESTFNVTAYAEANNAPELPLGFTVTVSSASCSNEVAYSVTTLMCDIPRGISPNGDGLNDSLDLTGTGVKKIEIYNRYGKKVFSHGSGYTNQWHGQDNNSNELPDGTYYYSIENADGSSKTGWVYINRPS